MTNPRHFLYVAVALIIFGLISTVFPFFMKPHKPTREKRELFTVRRVVDGDTIEISNGQLVRYIGVNASEIESLSCFSNESKTKNADLVEGKSIELEKDVSDKDSYGRLLRYVYVDGVMVNDVLAKEGYVQVVRIPPDIRYADTFTQSEQEARRARRGLWSDCRLTVVTDQVLGLEATSSAR